ncbi:unnamed protein product [Chondrus crispus]|uniref:Integrase catalytic domain-containing protein n=1 Tax=Chondrus crispus TaxID=2769 RepID=R7Q4V7_CHOCR|nr:unnamed protein product [Chondrus crispus]CDF32470.1 unnamed protein product [Chondrus crispus]|eukprot:XP_005712135.1 unnamed protein product [Chondrus crispus]
MPFGLTNTPAMFQRAMDILLSPFRWKCCLKAGVKLKLRKCEFFVEKIKYLGHVVRPGTLEVDAARIAALEQVRYPQTQTQLRSFLGLCNVYRQFVPHYAKIAHPLNQLLKKGQPVRMEGFDEPCEKSFHKLKGAILAPPVLALPKKDLPYSRNYSVSEKECLAVIWAVQTLRPYLYGEHFIVHTDHASLRWLMNVTDPSGRLIRWRLRLSEFDFKIKYKKGKANSQADALSRLRTAGETNEDRFDALDDILALEGGTAPDRFDQFQAVTPEELIREQAVDPFCNCIKEEMDAGKVRTFSMETEELEGTLCRTAAEFVQVVIPQSVRDRVLGLSHYAKLAGHPGGRKLYKTLRRYFYWPTMALDCYAVAKNCAACARERVKLRRNTKEMKLFTPKAPLEFVAIDILGELIITKRGNRYILVISDRYSKLVRTVPLKKISAAHIAQVFVHHWVFVYGPPVKLLSDNGTQFTARFFQNVCRILGIRNVFTTTYHPQANGQVERFNRTLTSALRKYVGEHPKDWDLFSDAVTFAYNTQVHRTTNIAPFELVLARAPRSIALQAHPMKRSDQGTVVIAIDDQGERVLRDRVKLAPSPMDLAPVTGLIQALRFLDGTERDEGRNVFENGGKQ